MDLREKRKMEQERQIARRKEEVVSAAVEIFKKQGIEDTKMTDIAKRAGVGVASVYRYFITKLDLVIEAARMFWDEKITELCDYYTQETFLNKSGIIKVKEILEVFLKLFQDDQDFIKFIYEFDSYVVREKISAEKLKFYEENILDLKLIIVSAFESGKEDGTIRSDINIEQFYFTITHALMSLCQKLVLRGHVLKSDQCVDGEAQIKMIIDMAVGYIENKECKYND